MHTMSYGKHSAATGDLVAWKPPIQLQCMCADSPPGAKTDSYNNQQWFKSVTIPSFNTQYTDFFEAPHDLAN
jgi:hypothetical protein